MKAHTDPTAPMDQKEALTATSTARSTATMADRLALEVESSSGLDLSTDTGMDMAINMGTVDIMAVLVDSSLWMASPVSWDWPHFLELPSVDPHRLHHSEDPHHRLHHSVALQFK